MTRPTDETADEMNTRSRIRDETKDDVAVIAEVTVKAFETLEISNKTEQYVIEALRAAGALTVSLVAEVDGRVVGHIALSPVSISDGSEGWYGLGPVSVLPARQRQGIGKALISGGLSRLRELGAQGCCLVGHRGYYRRLGFENVPHLVHEGVPPEFFFALTLTGRWPRGRVAFHEAFKAGSQPVHAPDATTRAPGESPLSIALPGTWRLLSRVDRTSAGSVVEDPALGSDPVALLIYDRAGNFSAQFMKRDRNAFSTAGAAEARNNTQVQGGYDAYFGTYTIDDSSGVVTQKLLGCLSQGGVGLVLSRAMSVVGNRLVIALETNGVDGTPVTRTLTWERIG